MAPASGLDEGVTFPAEITESGGSIRITIPTAARKALRLGKGDLVEIHLRRLQAPLVVDETALSDKR